MKETRLSSLALKNIHYDIPVNSDNVLSDFDSCGIRRLPFFIENNCNNYLITMNMSIYMIEIYK